MRSEGKAGNWNTAPGQVSRSQPSLASEGHDAKFVVDSGACLNPLRTIVHVTSYVYSTVLSSSDRIVIW